MRLERVLWNADESHIRLIDVCMNVVMREHGSFDN
jgi:hypothetical protein